MYNKYALFYCRTYEDICNKNVVYDSHHKILASHHKMMSLHSLRSVYLI